jgi:hypothetical protein
MVGERLLEVAVHASVEVFSANRVVAKESQNE